MSRLPAGPGWIYELKFDGYRALAIKTGKTVKLISRNQKDLTPNYPEIVAAVQRLPMPEGVLDGEIVALDNTGRPSFQALQHAHHLGRSPRLIYFYAFDILKWRAKDVTSLPLSQRKEFLREAIGDGQDGVRFAEALDGTPDAIVAEICRHSLEGVVAKRSNSRYESDKRSGAWVKLKVGYEQDFVIGGYTLGKGFRQHFGALIVGYYDNAKLRYASKVGTGFTFLQVRNLLADFAPLRQAQCPFEDIPRSQGSSWSYGLTAAELRTAIWLYPRLVCRVRFTEWTEDRHLRHPCFKGLSENKDAREAVRETSNR